VNRIVYACSFAAGLMGTLAVLAATGHNPRSHQAELEPKPPSCQVIRVQSVGAEARALDRLMLTPESCVTVERQWFDLATGQPQAGNGP
jgi:hypothetical protein